jgi:hypothetical protein
MVQSGLGIGVMPTAIVNPNPENTVLKNIQNLKLELPVGIAVLPEKTVPGLALNLMLKTFNVKNFARWTKQSPCLKICFTFSRGKCRMIQRFGV